MKKSYFKTVKMIVRGALIAAIYIALALLLKPLSFGQVQLRVSEALTILPIFMIEAVPGLFVGCLIANILGSDLGLMDIICGSLATLAAALLTRMLRKKPVLAMLPPVVINAFVVALVLYVVLALPYWASVAYVAIGQALACYAMGLPLYYSLRKLPAGIISDGPDRG